MGEREPKAALLREIGCKQATEGSLPTFLILAA